MFNANKNNQNEISQISDTTRYNNKNQNAKLSMTSTRRIRRINCEARPLNQYPLILFSMGNLRGVYPAVISIIVNCIFSELRWGLFFSTNFLAYSSIFFQSYCRLTLYIICQIWLVWLSLRINFLRYLNFSINLVIYVTLFDVCAFASVL